MAAGGEHENQASGHKMSGLHFEELSRHSPVNDATTARCEADPVTPVCVFATTTTVTNPVPPLQEGKKTCFPQWQGAVLQQYSFEKAFPNAKPYSKPRGTLSKRQTVAFERSFRKHKAYPSVAEMKRLSKTQRVGLEQVREWFEKRRLMRQVHARVSVSKPYVRIDAAWSHWQKWEHTQSQDSHCSVPEAQTTLTVAPVTITDAIGNIYATSLPYVETTPYCVFPQTTLANSPVTLLTSGAPNQEFATTGDTEKNGTPQNVLDVFD